MEMKKEILMERPKGIPAWQDVEIWQHIAGYEGYLISNFGNIMNATTGRRLKPYKTTSGYLQVTLSVNGYERKPLCIHKAVAEAFVKKPKPFPNARTEKRQLIVHHLDHNRENNHYDNLIWVSPAYHQRIHGVTEIAKERKEQKVVGKDQHGNIRIWASKKEARKYLGLSNNLFIEALFCGAKVHLENGETWEINRVLEIHDRAGNVKWQTPRKEELTENERKIVLNYLSNKVS